MSKTNSKLNYDYLATRHIDPKLIGPVYHAELACPDCKMNTELVDIEKFERQHMRKNCQIPLKCHHLEDIGVVMTTDSLLYAAHQTEHAKSHNLIQWDV